MTVVAIVQARTGSTRLPGKVLYPLAGTPAVLRVIERVREATRIDRVVLATTTHDRDDVLEACGQRLDLPVFRGDERDVLGRTRNAADEHDADIVVRICGDCPFVSPTVIDATVERLQAREADYAANKRQRTFPLGLDVEAFTAESFAVVAENAHDPFYREHVTPYYHDHADRFVLENLPSTAVFDQPHLHDRTDLRLVLDVAADYALCHRVYDDLGADSDTRAVIEHVDRHGLGDMNAGASQLSSENDS